jgi:hypothetical protein
MAFKVISAETMRDTRRQLRERGILTPLVAAEWPVSTVRELITTSDVDDFLTNKVEIDISIGLEDNPTLFEEIYLTRTDPNFGQFIPTTISNPAYGIIFLQKTEAGEVHFGALAGGVKGQVEIVRDASGIEYTQDMIDFNYLSQIEDVNVEFGRAWNAKRNHMTLGPIISYAYSAPNQTPADATASTYDLRVRKTIQNGLSTSRAAKRVPTVILCNSVDSQDVQFALDLRTDAAGQPLRALGPFVIIEYDGWSTVIDYGVANKTFSYPGVSSKKIYLIRPRVGFRYFVKRDLNFQRGDGDLSRFIAQQIVGSGMHGVLADVAGSVQEVTLPSS